MTPADQITEARCPNPHCGLNCEYCAAAKAAKKAAAKVMRKVRRIRRIRTTLGEVAYRAYVRCRTKQGQHGMLWWSELSWWEQKYWNAAAMAVRKIKGRRP